MSPAEEAHSPSDGSIDFPASLYPPSTNLSCGAYKEFTNPFAYVSTSPAATMAHPHAYHPYRTNHMTSSASSSLISTVTPLSLPGMLATPPDSVGSTNASLPGYSLSTSSPTINPSGLNNFVSNMNGLPNWTYTAHGTSSSIGSMGSLTSASSMGSLLGNSSMDLNGYDYTAPRGMFNGKVGPGGFKNELSLSEDELQMDDQSQGNEVSFPTSPNGRPRDEQRKTRIQSEQRRRNELREGFDRLRDALPPSNQRVSKANILDRAVQHIQHLTEAHRWLVQEHERVKRHEEELLRQHKRLTETVLQHSKQSSTGQNVGVNVPNQSQNQNQNQNQSQNQSQNQFVNHAPSPAGSAPPR